MQRKGKGRRSTGATPYYAHETRLPYKRGFVFVLNFSVYDFNCFLAQVFFTGPNVVRIFGHPAVTSCLSELRDSRCPPRLLVSGNFSIVCMHYFEPKYTVSFTRGRGDVAMTSSAGAASMFRRLLQLYHILGRRRTSVAFVPSARYRGLWSRLCDGKLGLGERLVIFLLFRLTLFSRSIPLEDCLSDIFSHSDMEPNFALGVVMAAGDIVVYLPPDGRSLACGLSLQVMLSFI
jgi:hypothetical protein